MANPISKDALDTLFLQARSHNGWNDTPVSDEQLHAVYELMKMGPTSANSCPARICFVKSQQAKEKLKPCLDAGNVEKSMSAPVVAIIGMDLNFYEKLPILFPHNADAPSWYAGKEAKIFKTAFLNSTLQGAYFMLAARAIGLDCGPMSGFNNQKVDEVFFPDGDIKSNFICAIGSGDASKLFDRLPRLSFEETCRIL